MRTHLVKGQKSALSVQYLTPEQKEIKARLVELHKLKNKLSTPLFVILVNECTDRVVVSFTLPGGHPHVAKYAYDEFQIRMAKAALLNAHADWSGVTTEMVAA